MEFASEMVIRAKLHNLAVTEVPTILSPDGRGRPPHLRSWPDGWRYLRLLLLYSPRWLFLYPGIGLFAIGAMAMIWLIIGPHVIGHVTFDIHTLVYAALATSLGYQSVLFALLTKRFAISENLLPDDPKFNRFSRHVTLESGLLFGGALAVIGIIFSISAVLSWRAQAYGPLNPFHMLRMIVPAALLIQLGVQTALSSLFLSVLGLRRR